MNKKMLINASHPEEHRAAIVEEGALTELEIEVVGREQTRGNIYKAVVVRVETGLQAAFVDYGADRLGFLQMGEIHPACYHSTENGSESRGRPRINDVLHRGQELLVQVVKEERGTKGAALTTFLSLPGRYMVLMPESDTKGVSRKIEEESQRKKLKSAMASMDLPNNMGYIVRTAGIGQTKEELKRDFDYLLRVYENILALSKRTKAPILVYKESNLVIRMIRDYFNTDIDEVLVDDPKVFQEAKDFFQQVMPEYARLVKLHQEKRPIFSRYQIEEQIETINKNKVPLPSGGSIVIDSTEALVAIDVNSGKMASEQGVEATAYKTNLEAAAEIGRQLRLRDLGGLIVIDFIDMRDRKHIREVEKCLKEALKMDKARVTVGHISSQFSLLEMSRQRIKTTLAEGAFLTCPHCDGSGRIKSTEAQAVAFMRKLQAGIAKGQIGVAEGEVPLDVATYLLNTRREELLIMERQHHLAIIIKGRGDLKSGQFELSFLKREKEEPAQEYVDAGSATPMTPVESGPIAEEDEEDEEKALEADAPEGAEEPGKKKRKRRRRKKKSSETATGSTGQTGDEAAEGLEGDEESLSATEEPGESIPQPEPTAEMPPAVGNEATGEIATDSEAMADEAAGRIEAVVDPAEATDTAVDRAPAIGEEESRTTRKPRRRRRKKPAAVITENPAITEPGDAPRTDFETIPAISDEKPEPVLESPETTPAVSTDAEEPLKKKPARRRRKKPATTITQDIKPEAGEPPPEAPVETSTDMPANATVPAITDVPPALAEASKGEPSITEPSVEDQPKPARGTRRAPRKKAENSAPPEGSLPVSEPEATKVAPEKKPATRKPRTTKPKAQTATEATTEEKPKRRATRTKTTEPPADE